MEKNKLYKQRYNEIMDKLGVAVKRILESYNDADLISESVIKKTVLKKLDEMAVNRAVNSKSYANVRDAIARKNYDETWAATVPALSKFSDTELLHRYVSALLIFGKECPQTEAEIDKIGVFANYAHKYIEDGGSLEDIIDLYSKNDKVNARTRKGITRGTKRAAKATEQPAEDFNFDDNAPEIDSVDAMAVPDYDDIEELPVSNTSDDIEEIPVGAEDDDDIDIPGYDEVDDDDDMDIPGYNDVDDEDDAVEVIDIEDINELTSEEFYDPNMNKSFENFNDDVILTDGDNIGFEVKITDDDTEESEVYTLYRENFGKALEDFDVVLQASIANMGDKFFTFEINPVINKFFKRFRNALSDDASDALDERIDKFYYDSFSNATSIGDIIEALDEMA